MRRIGVFIDSQSLISSSMGVSRTRLGFKKGRPDYIEIVNEIEAWFEKQVPAFDLFPTVYVGAKNFPSKLIDILEDEHIHTKSIAGSKAYDTCKQCDKVTPNHFGVNITMDILWGTLSSPKLYDTVVIVSCDKLWADVLRRLTDAGIACHVFGFEGAMSKQLSKWAIPLTDDCIYDGDTEKIGG